jgi:hypothetical protein
MSDESRGPGWWLAGDGKWYPPPPGISEPMPSRPPTPPPAHPPYAMNPGAMPPPAPPVIPPSPSNRGKYWAMAVVAVALVIVMLGLVAGLTARHSATTAAPDNREYRLVITDIVDAETTNEIFLQTFWEGYQQFVNTWNNATPEERAQITQTWLTDARAQVAQFRLDLQDIDEMLNAERFDNGSIPDSLRDAAVTHYRSWQSWSARVPDLAAQWSSDETASGGLDAYIDGLEPSLGNDINTSFGQLCDTLTTTKPDNGNYDATISSICPS